MVHIACLRGCRSQSIRLLGKEISFTQVRSPECIPREWNLGSQRTTGNDALLLVRSHRGEIVHNLDRRRTQCHSLSNTRRRGTPHITRCEYRQYSITLVNHRIADQTRFIGEYSSSAKFLWCLALQWLSPVKILIALDERMYTVKVLTYCPLSDRDDASRILAKAMTQTEMQL